MKCPSCNSDWNISEKATQSILKNCPFCGANLAPEEKPDTTTIEGILRSIVLEYGESLYVAENFKPLLSDYAAKFPKEKNLIGLAISEGIPKKLFEVNRKDETEKRSVIGNCVWLLKEDWGMTEECAVDVVNMLSVGLGWTIKWENSEKKQKDTSSDKRSLQKSMSSKTIKAPAGFVFVEGGTFSMGSTSDISDEKPVHAVTVSSFYMCDHEVTQKEYRDVTGKNPSHFRGDSRPVECVSWYDAIEYCNALSLKEGLPPCYTIDKSRKDSNNNSSLDSLKWTVTCNFKANGYRLPTEAEWEYAARGGKKSNGYTYSGSNSLGNVAWYIYNSGRRTHDVKTKSPNELGLYDMSGNVWEWFWDWYGSYSSSSQTNPTGAGSGSYRVRRGGGGRRSNDFSCRVASRFYKTPSCTGNDLGFRVVRSSFN